MFTRIGRTTALATLLTMVVGVGITAAHESRDVGDITISIGFIDEPVFLGQRSGLEFRVTHDGEPGAYRSIFFPTAAGPYTFHLFGEIDGEEIDESFTSGPDTFSEVQDVTGGQFPVQFPSTGDLVHDAEAGAAAGTTATIALVLGAAGLLAGLVARGMTLAGRRA